MGHMLRLLSTASVCLTLSACMIYAPTYAPQTSATVVHYEYASTQIQTELKQKTTEAKARVEQVPVSHNGKRSLDVCGKPTLPRGVRPVFLSADDIAATEASDDVKALDILVGTKVKELQTYIEHMHSEYEQAHAKWLESCKQKLLD